MTVDELVYEAAVAFFVEAVNRSKRMKKREQTVRRLELAMRKAFREQGRQFERGLRKFRDQFALQEGQAPSRPGQLREALTPSEWLFLFHVVAQKTFGLFEKPINQEVAKALQAGIATAVADVGMGLSFDLSNPRAVRYLEQYGARQVTKINETTRDSLQTILEQAASDGWSYDRTADAIIARYQEFAVGKPQMHIDSRAHLIAVTETGNAYAEGNLLVAQELKAAGLEMEKSWSTVSDDRVSEGCLENEAAGWIEIDQAFPSGHLRPLRFPGCRCDLLMRRKASNQ